MGILDDIRADPEYQALSVSGQFAVANRILAARLPQDPEFMALPRDAQERVKKRILASAPTFNDPLAGKRAIDIGSGYVAGAQGDVRAKNAYEFVHGMVRGSGILSTLSDAFELGPTGNKDSKRILDYYRELDNIQNAGSTWADIGNFIGQSADFVAISAAMSPLTGLATRGGIAAARGGEAALKAMKAQAITDAVKEGFGAAEATLAAGKLTVQQLPKVHPAYEALIKIGGDALTTAAPLYLDQELQRMNNGQRSIWSEGAGKVLQTLGENAAGNFVWGAVTGGVLASAARFGKVIFTMKPGEMAKVMERTVGDQEAQMRNMLATGDETQLSLMTPFQQAQTKANMRVMQWIDGGKLESDPFAQAAYAGQRFGMVPEQVGPNEYRIWKGKYRDAPAYEGYTDLNDLKNQMAFDLYKEYQALPVDIQDTFVDAGNVWILKRGQLLAEQEAKLGALDGKAVDEQLKAISGKGIDFKSPKDRGVITQTEASAIHAQNDPLNGATVWTYVPLSGTILENMKKGNNLFRNKDTIFAQVLDPSNQYDRAARVMAKTTLEETIDSTKSTIAVDPKAPMPQPNIVIFGTKGVTPDAWKESMILATQAAAEHPELSVQQIQASYLLDRGFDYVDLGNGNYGFFTPRNVKLLGTTQDVISALEYKGKLAGGPLGISVAVEQTSKFWLDAKAFIGNPGLVMRAASEALNSGSIDKMKQFAQLYLEGYGKVADVKVSIASGKVKPLTIGTDGAIHITVPSKNNRLLFYEQQQYMRQLFDDLKAIAGTLRNAKTGKYYETLFADRKLMLTPPKGFSEKEWVSNLADKLNYQIDEKSGAPLLFSQAADGSVIKQAFNSYKEAMDYLKGRATDPQVIIAKSAMEGIDIRQGANGVWTMIDRSKGKIIKQTKDWNELLDQLPSDYFKMDRQYGPKEIKVERGGLSIVWEDRVVATTKEELLKSMKGFEEQKTLLKQKWLKIGKDGTLSKDDAGNYRVHLQNVGYIENFESLAEARRFIEGGWKDIQHLTDIADSKGQYLTVENSKLTTKSYADGTIKRYDDVGQLIDDLGQYADLKESAPNVLDALDPSIEQDVASIAEMFPAWKKRRAGRNLFNQPPKELFDPDATPISAWMTIRTATSQFTNFARDVANRSNRPKFLELVYDVQKSRRVAEIQAQQVDVLIRKAFSPDGYILPRDQRLPIYYAMTKENSEEAAQGIARQYMEKFGKDIDGIELTEPQKRAMEQVNRIFETLSVKFQIDMKKHIFQYMPQIREWGLAHGERLSHPDNLLAEDLAKEIYGNGKIPKEVKFWAEHERTNGIFQYDTVDDPLELLFMYNHQGHKKLYMNETWGNLARYLNTDKVQDTALINRVQLYREQIMGYRKSPGEKVVADFGRRFFPSLKQVPVLKEALKGVSEAQLAEWGSNILRHGMSVTYMIQLGFKPWTAIRNALQNLTTLAPRFGLERTIKAMDRITKENGAYFDALRMKGVISDAVPLVDEVDLKESKLGKAMAASLQWIKNGDDYSRAVAYMVATESFEDGTKHLAIHPNDWDGFMRITGIRVTSKVDQDMLLKMVKSDRLEAAKDQFAMQVVKDTAFNNDSAEASMLRTGLIGKLFGQYGSFSESYRANMFNMLKYGTAADRIRMVSTYLAICGVMSSAFNGMQVKTNDFLPAGPGVFTGGPNFQLAVTALKTPQLILDAASGNWNVGDATTLNQLKFQAGGALPAAYQIRYFQKAAEYSKAGDHWKAFLAATGIPTTVD